MFVLGCLKTSWELKTVGRIFFVQSANSRRQDLTCLLTQAGLYRSESSHGAGWRLKLSHHL